MIRLGEQELTLIGFTSAHLGETLLWSSSHSTSRLQTQAVSVLLISDASTGKVSLTIQAATENSITICSSDELRTSPSLQSAAAGVFSVFSADEGRLSPTVRVGTGEDSLAIHGVATERATPSQPLEGAGNVSVYYEGESRGTLSARSESFAPITVHGEGKGIGAASANSEAFTDTAPVAIAPASSALTRTTEHSETLTLSCVSSADSAGTWEIYGVSEISLIANASANSALTHAMQGNGETLVEASDSAPAAATTYPSDAMSEMRITSPGAPASASVTESVDSTETIYPKPVAGIVSATTTSAEGERELKLSANNIPGAICSALNTAGTKEFNVSSNDIPINTATVTAATGNGGLAATAPQTPMAVAAIARIESTEDTEVLAPSVPVCISKTLPSSALSQAQPCSVVKPYSAKTYHISGADGVAVTDGGSATNLGMALPITENGIASITGELAAELIHPEYFRADSVALRAGDLASATLPTPLAKKIISQALAPCGSPAPGVYSCTPVQSFAQAVQESPYAKARKGRGGLRRGATEALSALAVACPGEQEHSLLRVYASAFKSKTSAMLRNTVAGLLSVGENTLHGSVEGFISLLRYLSIRITGDAGTQKTEATAVSAEGISSKATSPAMPDCYSAFTTVGIANAMWEKASAVATSVHAALSGIKAVYAVIVSHSESLTSARLIPARAVFGDISEVAGTAKGVAGNTLVHLIPFHAKSEHTVTDSAAGVVGTLAKHSAREPATHIACEGKARVVTKADCLTPPLVYLSRDDEDLIHITVDDTANAGIGGVLTVVVTTPGESVTLELEGGITASADLSQICQVTDVDYVRVDAESVADGMLSGCTTATHRSLTMAVEVYIALTATDLGLSYDRDSMLRFMADNGIALRHRIFDDSNGVSGNTLVISTSYTYSIKDYGSEFYADPYLQLKYFTLDTATNKYSIQSTLPESVSYPDSLELCRTSVSLNCMERLPENAGYTYDSTTGRIYLGSLYGAIAVLAEGGYDRMYEVLVKTLLMPLPAPTIEITSCTLWTQASFTMTAAALTGYVEATITAESLNSAEVITESLTLDCSDTLTHSFSYTLAEGFAKVSVSLKPHSDYTVNTTAANAVLRCLALHSGLSMYALAGESLTCYSDSEGTAADGALDTQFSKEYLPVVNGEIELYRELCHYSDSNGERYDLTSFNRDGVAQSYTDVSEAEALAPTLHYVRVTWTDDSYSLELRDALPLDFAYDVAHYYRVMRYESVYSAMNTESSIAAGALDVPDNLKGVYLYSCDLAYLPPEDMYGRGNCGSSGEVDDDGFGDNLKWILYKTGLLYVYGEGEMANFDSLDECGYGDTGSNPWTYYLSEKRNESVSAYITDIEVAEGVTVLGEYAFAGCGYAESLSLPDSLLTISNHALPTSNIDIPIHIPQNVTAIGSIDIYTDRSSGFYLYPMSPPSFDGICDWTYKLAQDDMRVINTTGQYYIYVPVESLSAYKTAYSDYAEIIKEIS